MFKKLFLAILICLFSASISNAVWQTDIEGKADALGRIIVKAWYNKYDDTLVLFYDQDNDGKLDKRHHFYYRGQSMGDLIVGTHTEDAVKTVDEFIEFLKAREKTVEKQHKEAKEKELKNKGI